MIFEKAFNLALVLLLTDLNLAYNKYKLYFNNFIVPRPNQLSKLNLCWELSCARLANFENLSNLEVHRTPILGRIRGIFNE